MRPRLSDYRLFLREFGRTFHTTGAVLPSGGALSRALASRVELRNGPRRILEIGPGTGAVTDQIVARLGPEDHLDLVEVNERFVGVLQERLQSDRSWRAVSQRVHVMQMSIEQLDEGQTYDVLVSGLPLNNFSCEFLQRLVDCFHRLAKPQAALSFFEYVAIRKAKSLICRVDGRRRLAGIEQILRSQFDAWEVDRQCVLANVPPAWVHHLQLPGTTANEPTGDGPTGDGPTGDGPTGDGPTGDGPTGDGPTGDGPTGDGPTGDGPTGREQIDPRQPGNGLPVKGQTGKRQTEKGQTV